MEQNNKDSFNKQLFQIPQLSNNENTCFYCRSEEPLAFHIENYQVKLIGIACILIKSGSYKKDEFSSLINLKKVIKDAAEPVTRDWETFSEYLSTKIQKVEKDSEILDKKKSCNEIENFCSFIADFNDQLNEFKNSEVNKILEFHESSLSKAKLISQKIKFYKDFYFMIKSAVETENISEVSNVLSFLLKPDSELNQANFKKEIISITKMLNEYVDSSEKNKNSVNLNSNLISKDLNKEIQNCMSIMTSVLNKIKSAIRKGNDAYNNDLSQVSNNNLSNYNSKINNYPNNDQFSSDNNGSKLSHLNGYNNNFKPDFFASETNIYKGNVNKPFRIEVELENNNNNISSVNPEVANLSTYTFGADSKNSKFQEENNYSVFHSSEKKDTKSNNLSTVNESYRYLIHANVFPSNKSTTNIVVLQTNNKTILEKVIATDLAKNKKELLVDCRFVNTGEGLLISGGHDKAKSENSKQCMLIQIEKFDELKKNVDLVFHDLPPMIEGRRRHNMIHFKSTLFDSEKRLKSIVLCLSGLRTVTCEMFNLDNFDNWKKLPDLHFSRSNATTFIMNDFVYVFGGFQASSLISKDKKDEYVKSVEFISLKEIASYSNDTNKNYSCEKWELLNFSSSYLSYCAYSVFRPFNKNFDNSIYIIGGFDSKNHEEIYKVSISNLEDWKLELCEEKMQQPILFLNSNFVQGENGLHYAFAFNGKLHEIKDMENLKISVLN